jgi:hypothetical protein
MKTLYDRLKHEHLIQLNENTKRFPIMNKIIIDALKENTSWLQLTFAQIIDLLQLTTGEDTTITNVAKLFENGK